MIELRYLIFSLFILPIWFYYRRQSLRKKNKSLRVSREFIIQLFFLYILAVIYLTMRPFEFQIPYYGNRPFHFDTQLFYQLTHMARSHWRYQILYSIGNILMFIPFGMLAPIIFPKLRYVIVLIFCGFIFSLIIELTQALFTLTRSATVDDLVFNTVGALLGYFVFLILSAFASHTNK